MIKEYMILCLLLLAFSCSTNNRNNEKDLSYDCDLSAHKSNALYKEAFSGAEASFQSWKIENPIFNSKMYEDQKLSDLLIFNTHNMNCFGSILQLSQNGSDFDKVRIIRGSYCNGKWIFNVGMQISYRKENDLKRSIEELSQLHQEYILRQGANEEKCQIDEEYWFAANASYPKC